MSQTKVQRRNGARALLPAVIAIIALTLFGAGASAGTITGSTGLIEVPSADVLAAGEFETTVRYLDDGFGVSAVYGIFDDVEVGVNNIRPAENSEVGLFIKGVLFPETDRRPAVAIGLETGQSYATVSKRLLPGMRVHGGLGFGRIQGAFAGVSYSLNTVSSGMTAPATTLMAEYTPLGLNFGARMVFSPMFSADVALLDSSEVTAGLNIRFGF